MLSGVDVLDSFTFELNIYSPCQTYAFYLNETAVEVVWRRTDDPHWILKSRGNENDYSLMICGEEKHQFNLSMEISWTINPQDGDPPRQNSIELHYFSEIEKPEFFWTRKHSDISVYTSPYFFLGDSRIICEDLTEDECYSDLDNSCDFYQQIAANDPPPIFWPLPSLTILISTKTPGIWENEELYVPSLMRDWEFRLNNSQIFRFLISYDFDSRVRLLTNKYFLPTCSAVILRPPFGRDGQFYPYLKVNVSSPKEGSCEYKELQNFQNAVISAFSNMNNKEAQNLTNARFELDLLMMSAVVWDCQNFLLSNLTFASREIQLNHDKLCAIPDSDPFTHTDTCCNPYLQWRDLCVDRFYNTTVWRYTPNVLEIGKICANPECIEEVSLFELYKIRSSFRNREKGCAAIPPASFFFIDEQLLPFTSCLKEFVLYPAPCFHDLNCTMGRCDLTTFTCLQNRSLLEESFFNCVWAKLDPFVRQYLLNLKGLPLDASSGDVFLTFLSRDCSGEFSLDVPGRTKVGVTNGDPTCDFASNVMSSEALVWDCIDQSCWYPFEIDYRVLCPRSWIDVPADAELCESEMFCNWNESIQCKPDDFDCQNECEDDSHFCGWCEDGLHCYEIPHVIQPQCEDQLICTFPNGTVKQVKSSLECTSVFGCTRGCLDPKSWTQKDCVDETECRSLGGRCVIHPNIPITRGIWDAEILSRTDEEFFAVSTGIPHGICHTQDIIVTDLKNASCFLENHDLGFVIYQKPTQLGCLAFTNESNCALLGGRWIDTFATSEAECLLYGEICDEPVIDIGFHEGFMNLNILTAKDKNECLAVPGAHWVNKTQWLPGQWISGTIRTPEWIKREYRNKNQVGETVDLPQLRKDITDAARSKLGYSIKTEAYCLYRQLMEVIETAICDCSNISDSCFSRRQFKTLTGVTVVCNGQGNTAIFPPNQVYFSNISVPPGACQDLSIYSLDISSLNTPAASVELSTTLFSFEEKTKFKFSLKNEHNTFVGQVIGNGISFESSIEGQDLTNVKVCMTTNVDFAIKSTYIYPDFGILVDISNSRVQALNLPANITDTEDGQMVCAFFSHIKSGEEYVPLLRREGWEDADDSTWSQGELFGGYFLASLYSVLFMIGLFELKYLFSISRANKTRIRQRYLVAILVFFNCLRALYFFLLMGGALQDANTTLDYLFIDFVTILFFSSFITYLLYMWVNALFATSILRQHLSSIAFLINFLIYGFFLGMIIAFELTGETSEVYWCGELRSSTPDTSTQDSIKLAYRIVLACVSFIIGVAFLGVGLSLVKSLGEGANQSKSRKDDQMKRMLLNMTLTISVSFVLQSVFFLVIELTDISDMAFTVPLLIVVEIIPCAVILFSLRPKDVDSKSHSTASSSTNRTI